MPEEDKNTDNLLHSSGNGSIIQPIVNNNSALRKEMEA